jgi:hypothetical protein
MNKPNLENWMPFDIDDEVDYPCFVPLKNFPFDIRVYPNTNLLTIIERTSRRDYRGAVQFEVETFEDAEFIIEKTIGVLSIL